VKKTVETAAHTHNEHHLQLGLGDIDKNDIYKDLLWSEGELCLWCF